jgi:CubicO group peptidase (beta-lactamase class C family)
VTLGIIIHKVSGKFYGDFLAERVFKPLGMTTARIISERDIVPNRAAGYELRNGKVGNQDWVSPSLNTTADGALYLSALDMIKWEEGLAGGKLLSKDSYSQMWSRAKLNDGRERRYGFGWALRMLNGKLVIEHGGAWQGFKSFIARYPDRKLAVIVFANLADVNPSKLATGIAEAFDPTLKPRPIADADPKRTDNFRQLFESVLDGKIDPARFAPSIRDMLQDPNDRLLAHLKRIRPIVKFDLIELPDPDGSASYRYRAEFRSMAVTIEIETDKEGRIQYFELHPE